MSAASNQWAAVGDAVNSATLLDMGFTVVRLSLQALGVFGAAKFVSRGPGGYNDRLTELDTIIQCWDEILTHLDSRMIARIEADNGLGSVKMMRDRLNS